MRVGSLPALQHRAPQLLTCLAHCAASNAEETLSTLRYANRAKNIRNKPRVNEDPKVSVDPGVAGLRTEPAAAATVCVLQRP